MVWGQISRCAAYLRDSGVAGGIVERPGGGVPVDGPGRAKRTARPRVFPVGAQRGKIHIHESRPKGITAGAAEAAALPIRTGSGKMATAVFALSFYNVRQAEKTLFPAAFPCLLFRGAPAC